VSELNGDLLAAIPGSHPAGPYLRYDPIYEQIKEARRADDDLPQGDWQTTRKVADWPLVIRLCTDALTKKTKDLQIAVWLTEAWLHREGFAGLRRGLTLLHQLLEQHWDTLHPEIEDGDADMRGLLLDWLGSRFDTPVRLTALNQHGHSLIAYEGSRSVPTQEDADSDSGKAEERQTKLEEGHITPEDFERGFIETSKEWYRAAVADIDGVMQLLKDLESVCGEHREAFSEPPGFGGLRTALEEVRRTASQLLGRKQAMDPDPVSVEPEAPAVADAAGENGQPVAAGTAAPAVSVAGGPRSREEAATWITAAAKKLRQEQPSDPTAYLLLRGLRWGELRAGGGAVDARLLMAPSTDVRTKLKGLLLDAAWPQLLSAAEDAMAQPYGRGWLDLQRYVLTATDGLGPEYEPVGTAVRGALRVLLVDLPDLLAQTLMDDSPTANAETMAWLGDENLVPSGTDDVATKVNPRRNAFRRDAFDVAKARAAGGDAHGAMEMLMREATQEKSARARFLRRAQAAEIMVGAGMESIAMPILRELVTQIESHQLEDWEAGDAVAQPLALLYRCARRLDSGDVDADSLYQRICRLDPVQAIQLQSNRNTNEGE
jgi:type VI secretion system protein ImpA